MTTHDHIRLRDAEQIINAVNEAAEIDGTDDERVESLLRHLQRLLGRPAIANLLLLGELTKPPAPRILTRFVVTADGDKPPLDDADIQKAAELLGPIVAKIVTGMLSRIRTPDTVVFSEIAGDEKWFKELYTDQIAGPHGYIDTMTSSWAASDDRAISMSIHRLADAPPFSEDDQALMSLILRAVAPFVDREIFNRPDALAGHDLTLRQREVLMLLLSGNSEKGIAKQIHRSVHTVHSFVKQLYSIFDVSSRGELMAMFVDRAVVREAAADGIET
jgi:DNA-binding CsgD family transcriptional regulator